MRRLAFVKLDHELHASGQTHDALPLGQGSQVLFIANDIRANVVHAPLLVVVDNLAPKDLNAKTDGTLIDLCNALGENEGGQPALASCREQDIEGVNQSPLRFAAQVGNTLLWQPVLRLIQEDRAGKALALFLAAGIRNQVVDQVDDGRCSLLVFEPGLQIHDDLQPSRNDLNSAVPVLLVGNAPIRQDFQQGLQVAFLVEHHAGNTAASRIELRGDEHDLFNDLCQHARFAAALAATGEDALTQHDIHVWEEARCQGERQARVPGDIDERGVIFGLVLRLVLDGGGGIVPLCLSLLFIFWQRLREPAQCAVDQASAAPLWELFCWFRLPCLSREGKYLPYLLVYLRPMSP